MDRDHARFIQQCIDKVGAENHTLVKGDAFRFMKSCKRQFDFIFADPPYSLPTLETIPDLALPLLKEGGMMVFEHGKQNDFSQHPHFVEKRVYGAVNFSLFR
jgi:16S rRNA G966 N2-methylase RsmD